MTKAVAVRLKQLALSGLLMTTQSLWAAANPAVQMLLAQARYWHQKAHNDLARQALQKVLMAEDNNADALYLMALWSQQQGDSIDAMRWRARLAQADPQDPKLSELNYALEQQAIPAAQLAQARQQARSGNIRGALQTWRSMLHDNSPPPSLAVEYYLTMAGDSALLPQAIAHLRQFCAIYPQDTQAQLALGKALTYQTSTRREGVKLLATLADGSPAADQALRKGLLWLEPQPQDAVFYQQWMQRHPQDSAVQAYYQKHVGSAQLEAGYTALNRGDILSAQHDFAAIVHANPQDADALAGLGYIAQRQGRFAQAADYLGQAAKLGGANGAQRQKQANDAAFYARLATARAALKAGNSAEALRLSAPLAEAAGSRGVAAKLFRADVLRLGGQLQPAEAIYRSLVRSDADNLSAKEGLFYVLHQQHRDREASELLASLPVSVQDSLASPDTKSNRLRRQAQQALKAGDQAQAIALLQQGIARYPDNAWLRLDLATIFQRQGKPAQADDVMQPAGRAGASHQQLLAAALYAAGRGRWLQVQNFLARIPVAQRGASVAQLQSRARFNLQMVQARQYLAQGEVSAADNTLEALAVDPPKNPIDVGSLAQALMQTGDSTSAVAIVRGNLQLGAQGNVGEYAAQLAVLNQAGLSDEACRFLNDPALLARSTPSQLAAARNEVIINQADRLREQGLYATAYDKLIAALQGDPQNRDLMLAMARLYQSGKMNKQAGVVYRWLMAHDPTDQQARTGAINAALAQQQVAQAETLADGFTGKPTPARLLLRARIAEAAGDKTQALAWLRRARAAAVGQPGEIAGLALGANPFSQRALGALPTQISGYGIVMPWQRSAAGGAMAFSGAAAPVDPATQTLRQIDAMTDRLHRQLSSWAGGGLQIRQRSGESGLSKLTEVKTPLSWSAVPFNNSRLKLSLTPVLLSAGSAAADASSRFGSVPLRIAHRGQKPGRDNLYPIGAQNASGLEADLQLSGDPYKVDIGSTPLGPHLHTLVGGVQWSPKLSDYLTLILSGERRAVTDSLLSYVGMRDKLSGKRWGEVTKNGGSAMLSYDNGRAGFYIGGGGYRYTGHHVQTNQSFDASAGLYIRPYHTQQEELKTGLGINWMDFRHNLNYFTYGQGGYFSPQNYLAVSLPVDFSRRYRRLRWNIGGALDYQSYTQHHSPLFPDDPALQAQSGTWYPGSSKSGLGYDLHAGIGYRINHNLSVGGQLGYDTFIDYSESTAQLWLRYLFGVNNDGF
ncbi:hypothetical protein BTJ39_23510 [Izhakiella australiensis]|uniref:Cellulose synthase operon C C-terminal domain-containing protein n=1 Tax=Izhakiella australiensis TaxID=1926881 RepID=A0A1S8Y6G6_9GAMM|nr:cellulose biosynthesis protein BcsC [Izhakiella australiensis]OON34691.1 hypothetical protein BTJ39_23510 [Izhakiella australiensis]